VVDWEGQVIAFYVLLLMSIVKSSTAVEIRLECEVLK